VLKTGAGAPDFQIGDFSLAEALKAGPLVLVLFKVSCPTCQFTLPFIERLYGRGLRVFGISQDDAGTTREFTDYFGVTFPMLLDGRGCPVSNAYGIEYVPSVFVIEQDARISQAFNGFHKAELERLGERVGGSPFREAERVPAMRPG
jgi:peroxiredoxin